jgi:hypothetical protein
MAVDPAEQAAFIDGLRKKAEELIPKNPVTKPKAGSKER